MVQPDSQCALTNDYVGACQNATNRPNNHCNDGRWYQPPLAKGADADCDNDPADCYQDYCDAKSNGEIRATAMMSIPYLMAVVLVRL